MADQPPQSEALGYDTHFQSGDTDDYNTVTTWTDVFAEPTDIQPPEETIKTVDSSHMQSPSMKKQKVGGWGDSSSCKVTAHYNIAEYLAVKAWGRAQQSFRIVYNDPTSGDSPTKSATMFNAIVSKLGHKPKMEELVDDEFEFEPTGPISDVDNISGVI